MSRKIIKSPRLSTPSTFLLWVRGVFFTREETWESEVSLLRCETSGGPGALGDPPCLRLCCSNVALLVSHFQICSLFSPCWDLWKNLLSRTHSRIHGNLLKMSGAGGGGGGSCQQDILSQRSHISQTRLTERNMCRKCSTVSFKQLQ